MHSMATGDLCRREPSAKLCRGSIAALLTPGGKLNAELDGDCGGRTLTETGALTAPDLASTAYSEPSWIATISTSSDSKKMPSTWHLGQSLCEALHRLVPDL